MLRSKLHCQKGVDLIPFSYKLRTDLGGVLGRSGRKVRGEVVDDDRVTPSPHLLDQIPLYSPLYLGVHVEGLVTCCLSLSPLSLPSPLQPQLRPDLGGVLGRGGCEARGEVVDALHVPHQDVEVASYHT